MLFGVVIIRQRVPGSEGFNFNFIKSSWDIVKTDVISMVKDFWEHETLPNGLNVAFISLIPKVDHACELKDFKPISLVGYLYKIIAKILARRLKLVMSSLVSECQSSFIHGR